MRTPPFNPAIPGQPPEVRRFATQVVEFVDRPERNEFTVTVPVPEATLDLPLWSAAYEYTPMRRAGWSPYYDKFVLRRVRVAAATTKNKAYHPFPGVLLKAMVQIGTTENVVGTFSTFDYALNVGAARTVSGSQDIDLPLTAGSVFSVEATYQHYPPVRMGDAVMLFDVGVR